MKHCASYYRYWGKSKDDDWHCLPYHCLDVGAVGLALLEQHAPIRDQLAKLTGFSPAEFTRWAVFLLVLHDVGKFAVTFQNARPDLLNLLQGRESQKIAGHDGRHDTTGLELWRCVLADQLQGMGLITLGAGRRTTPQTQAIDFWVTAMTGHHGTPPNSRGNFNISRDFEPPDQQAAVDFFRDTQALLLHDVQPFPVLDVDHAQQIRFASWWLSGFAVLCDWIGSNRAQFAYCSAPMPLRDYWKEVAYPIASQAIQRSALCPKPAASDMTLEQLLSTEQPVEATPLQHLAHSMTLLQTPQLLILEDVTGAGKTEAALILAQRLMKKGLGHGIYFGLPTMATANAMYQRLGEQSYANLFETKQQPTLVLAHGAAQLSSTFRASIIADSWSEEESYGQLEGAAAYCTQWLSDNRKKALLADVGIGTIDQALLATLPNKHHSLRMLGLIGKVLIVDEVHSCDAYMLELLCATLTAHAASGGSAILLSATLPQAQRQQLADAYNTGLSTPLSPCESTPPCQSTHYPLLTQVGSAGVYEFSTPTRSSVAREVKVRCLHSIESVEAEIAQALRAGQCICWIRNSVADACEAFHRLSNLQPDWAIDLFHARFALADRLIIEDRILSRFGKHSCQRDRSGQILIATQVVEQSLDLDFDCLITDLAPIDLLIQRAGRCRRHLRNSNGDPSQDHVDHRGIAELLLHTPVWSEDPQNDWFAEPFPRAGSVYPDHGKLWLSQRLLQQAGKFRMPEDARLLIEGVYGPDVNMPDGLQPRTDEAHASNKAEEGLARLNTLTLDNGYCDEASNIWWDETKTPTRLGEPTSTIWLARWQNNTLIPWCEDDEHAWQQSAVSLRSAWVGEIPRPDAVPQTIWDAGKATQPGKGKWGHMALMLETDTGYWEAKGKTADGKPITYRYSQITGLEVEFG